MSISKQCWSLCIGQTSWRKHGAKKTTNAVTIAADVAVAVAVAVTFADAPAVAVAVGALHAHTFIQQYSFIGNFKPGAGSHNVTFSFLAFWRSNKKLKQANWTSRYFRYWRLSLGCKCFKLRHIASRWALRTEVNRSIPVQAGETFATGIAIRLTDVSMSRSWSGDWMEY